MTREGTVAEEKLLVAVLAARPASVVFASVVFALVLLALVVLAGSVRAAEPLPAATGAASQDAAPEKSAAAQAPVVDALIGTKRTTVTQRELAERAVIAADKDVRVVEVGRDASSSHHIVAVRSAEKPHRHDRHALLVLLLRGHGRMNIGGEQREVAEGSLLYVPPGVVHAFTNDRATPSVAYVIYTPPYDGTDWIGVEEAR